MRHGETDWNRQHRFQGQIDVPLNAAGRAQAERLAQRLAHEVFDVVVSSDLQRARSTAELAAAGRAIVSEPLWREQAFGVLEGLDASTIIEQHPAAVVVVAAPRRRLRVARRRERAHVPRARAAGAAAPGAAAQRRPGGGVHPRRRARHAVARGAPTRRWTGRASATSPTPASTACAGTTASSRSSSGPMRRTSRACPSSPTPRRWACADARALRPASSTRPRRCAADMPRWR